MKIDKAVDDYVLSSTIDGLSPLTIEAYKSSLTIYIRYLGDRELESITVADIKEFMGHLRTDYRPSRPNGSREPQLATVFGEAMRRVLTGEMQPDTFRALAQYAAFQIQTTGEVTEQGKVKATN